eukprot:CAMPEP_0184692106 /NCGR_PEP_ID=MMETSP0313-20130426/723_1 /TAXON_ID=2792 /ORGANISM="Porphyridium aerugineum, Strain SAG 1380-2" /LENGTH=296 /DNA_ID=CAMNT_0027149913 /DNA_START=74 /DNA_END=964 /DNA_ORIENTATION=-
MGGLKDLSVADLSATLTHQKLHALSIDSDVYSAFEYMDHEKIIVAPVKTASGSYDYLLGVEDLVDYCVLQVAGQENNLQPENIPRLKDKLSSLLKSKPETHFALPHIKETSHLSDILVQFAQGRHKVFVDAAQPYLISQHDMIKFLNDKPELVPETLKKSTVQTLGYCPRSIFIANNTDSALHVLRKLISRDINAAPIVDANGMIIGNFSTSDLKGMDDVMLQDLNLNCVEFLKEENARGAGHPIEVKEDAKFGEVMLLLAFSGAHRVWITDASKKPVGVVSMTDLLSSILTCLSA